MEKYLSSDLACEKFGSTSRESDQGEYSEEKVEIFKIIRLTRRQDGHLENYITIECGRIWELDEMQEDKLCEVLSRCIRELTGKITSKPIGLNFSVLVAGLGNADITVDAIGPECIKGITATKQLKEYDEDMFESLGCCEVAAIATGVLGQTGVESVDLIRGVLKSVRADLVIVIDALAARDCERLAATVQLSDAGIDPGAGIGNHRKKIDVEALGVPTIVIGVPTVVNSASLICDAIRAAGIEKIDKGMETVLERGRSFYVAPKESDLITVRVARILSRSIGLVFSEAFV